MYDFCLMWGPHVKKCIKNKTNACSVPKLCTNNKNTQKRLLKIWEKKRSCLIVEGPKNAKEKQKWTNFEDKWFD